MQERSPVTSMRKEAALPSSARLTPRLSSEERRKIFKGMVIGELEAGFLRYSRRQALMQYAQTLGIGEFEASLLMAEAQYQASGVEPVSFESAASLANATRPESWSVSLRLSFALLAAIFIDLLLIHWLFG